MSRNMAAINLNVGIAQQNEHPEGTVFVVLDTSGSMAGSKINQVIESLEEIIGNAPPYLRFCVRVFNTKVKLLVTKKKQFLDFAQLVEDIRETVGSCTALYDAWGVTLKEIPYNASKLDLVHVVIFSDGEDNCSRKYNLNSVLNLSKERIRGSRMQLSFIQAGYHSEASRAIGQMDQSNFNMYNVEDSANGIKFAFEEVSKAIQLQIQLRVNMGSGAGQIAADLGILHLGNPGRGRRGQPNDYLAMQQIQEAQRPALLPRGRRQ